MINIVVKINFMKRTYSVLIALIVLSMVACKSNTEKEETAITKKVEELKVLKPLQDNDMKKFLPKTLGETKRGNIILTNFVGKMVFAVYSTKEHEDFKVFITDCAGKKGANKYVLNYVAHLAVEDNMPEAKAEEKRTTQKQYDFAGGKAIAFYSPLTKAYSFVYMTKGRLHVGVEGPPDATIEEVMTFATNLNAKL